MTNLKLLAMSAVLGLALSAQAAKISGSIDMSGTVFLDNMFLGSATKANSFSSVTVGGIPTGTFAGTAGSVVAWSSFGWNPSTTPVSPLWTFTSGPATYSFNLLNVNVSSQNNQFLNLLGSGTLKATGFEDTTGAWSFTISNPSGGRHANFAFTFANSQTSVPDGGVTAMMIGGALAVLVLFRRQIA